LNKVFHNHLGPLVDHALCQDQERESQEQADGDREIEKKRNPDRSPESKPFKGRKNQERQSDEKSYDKGSSVPGRQIGSHETHPDQEFEKKPAFGQRKLINRSSNSVRMVSIDSCICPGRFPQSPSLVLKAISLVIVPLQLSLIYFGYRYFYHFHCGGVKWES